MTQVEIENLETLQEAMTILVKAVNPIVAPEMKEELIRETYHLLFGLYVELNENTQGE